jgi:hypothetical protein
MMRRLLSPRKNSFLIAIFCCHVFFALAEVKQGRRHQRKEQRESDPDRIKKAFLWVAVLLFLAVAPLVIRFFHVLFTDPAIPVIWKEGKGLICKRLGIKINAECLKVELDKDKQGIKFS